MAGNKTIEDDLRDFLAEASSPIEYETMQHSPSGKSHEGDHSIIGKLLAHDDNKMLPTHDEDGGDDYEESESVEPIGEDEKSAKKSPPFDWSSYLANCQAEAAPDDCFYQNPTPPKNLFKEDKKLEVPDPRGPGCMCLATIQAVHGVWICVRMDGCDDANDQWMICDDHRIHPVGYSVRTGGSLQPPVGFRPNISQFHRFIEGQLRRDDDGESPACLEDWFLLNFDGWNYAYNVTEKFSSRNLFPVGWAKRAGLNIQPPKKISGKVKTTVFSAKDAGSSQKTTLDKSKKERPKKVAKKRLVAEAESLPRNERTKKGIKLEETLKRLKESEPPMMTSVSLSPPSKRQKSSSLDDENKPKKSSARKSFMLRSSTDNKPVQMPSNPHQKTAGSTSNTGSKSASTLTTQHTSGTISDVVISGPDTVFNMTIYVNRHCQSGAFLDRTKLVDYLNDQIGPANVNHVIRETVQQMVNCAVDVRSVFKKIEPGLEPRVLNVTADIGGNTHVRCLPIFDDVPRAWQYLKKISAKLGLCPYLLSKTDSCCPHCGSGSGSESGKTVKRGRKGRTEMPESDSDTNITDKEVNASSHLSPRSHPLEKWTIEQVAESITALGDAHLSDKFLLNVRVYLQNPKQIDGKALQLLTAELMMKHMELPFGPALKVIAHRDAIEGRSTTF